MNETLKISPAGRDLIKRSESLRLEVYRDLNGFATIAYGHKVRTGEHFFTVTEAQAETILDADIAEVEEALYADVKVELTQGQFDGLGSFTFNLGEGKLQSSTLLSLLNSGQYDRACRELYHTDGDGHMGGWIFAAGVVQPGLVTRRQAEQKLWNS